MDKKVLKQLETRLSTKRIRLLKAVQRRLQECRDSGGYRLPDVIDVASLSSVDELGMLVTEAEVRELKEIDDAMTRIRSGSYGVCKNCGCTIRKDRLKALPYATLCIKCKEEEEKELEIESRLGKGEAYTWATEAAETEEEEPEREVKGRIKDVEGEFSFN